LSSGLPTQITVDSALPYDRESGRLLYATGGDSRELWGPILEKAYAAHYENYGRMGEKGGVSQYAMAELTGHVVQTVVTQRLGVTKTLAALELAVREQRPMLAQTNRNVLSGCNVKRNGVVDGHSYAVLDVQHTAQGAFVVLRDPMGQSEYRSRSYDSDAAYNGARASRHDGIFRVSIRDFCRLYYNVVMMTNDPLPTRRPSQSANDYQLPPPSVVTVSHIERAGNPRPPPPICDIPN
jgi:hypothetical protein